MSGYPFLDLFSSIIVVVCVLSFSSRELSIINSFFRRV